MTEIGPLLDFAAEVGFQIQTAGGEIYRVEESVRRLLAAYGAQSGEVFAIPNCITVSVADGTLEAQTRIRRVPDHGTDIYRLEAVNDLCRRLCREPRPVAEAQEELRRIVEEEPVYKPLIRVVAAGVGGGFFTLFFGGCWADGLCAGGCGVLIGFMLILLGKLGTNAFFRTISAAAVSALAAVGMVRLGWGHSVDLITIGAFMNLVPGVALTTAIRDIMAGDTVSGISKLGEAILIAIAIAVGTGLAMWLGRWIGGMGL